MKLKLLITIFAFILTNQFVMLGADSKDKLKKELLKLSDRWSHYGGNYTIEEIHKDVKKVQKQVDVTDRQVRKWFHTAIRRFLDGKEPIPEKKAKENALFFEVINLLRYYGNEKTITLLEKTIKDAGASGLRQTALKSYMHLTDHRITDLMRNIVAEKEPYGKLAHGVVTGELKRAYHKAKKQKNKEKAERIIVFLKEIVKKASWRFFARLDCFLKEEKEGYASSQLRHRLLNRHYTPETRKVKSGESETISIWDKYIKKELKKFENKKAPDSREK